MVEIVLVLVDDGLVDNVAPTAFCYGATVGAVGCYGRAMLEEVYV